MYYKVLLPLPPTLNEQIDLARSHWSISAKEKKRWGTKLKSKLVLAPEFKGKIWQQFTWFTTFANDPDNVSASVKYINDALVASNVLTKDNLMIIQSPYVHHFQRKTKGRKAEVILEISDAPMIITPAELEIDDLCPF